MLGSMSVFKQHTHGPVYLNSCFLHNDFMNNDNEKKYYIGKYSCHGKDVQRYITSCKLRLHSCDDYTA